MIKECPVCGEVLTQQDRTFRCGKGHSFDLSASGYLNLLMPQKGGSKNHGDTKEMVVARRRFLRKGFYEPLSQAINRLILAHVPPKSTLSILDAGCGEGYYTERLHQYLSDHGINPMIEGYDVSKQAIMVASKSCQSIFYGVASLFHLPIQANQTDLVLNLFAPICPEEFRRVGKDGSLLLVVAPDSKHLWGLKSALYDQPYENVLSDPQLEGYELEDSQGVSYEIFLESQQEIQDLFSMTPYYWKTSLADKEKLSKLEHLTTKVEFMILLYRKKS